MDKAIKILKITSTIFILLTAITAIFYVFKSTEENHVVTEFTYRSEVNRNKTCVLSDFQNEKIGQTYINELKEVIRGSVYGYDFNDVKLDSDSKKYIEDCNSVAILSNLDEQATNNYFNESFISFIKENKNIHFILPADIRLPKLIEQELKKKDYITQVSFLTFGSFNLTKEKAFIQPENLNANMVLLDSGYESAKMFSQDVQATIKYHSYYLSLLSNRPLLINQYMEAIEGASYKVLSTGYRLTNKNTNTRKN